MIELIFLGLLAGFVAFLFMRKNVRTGTLIPGPKGLPIIGHTFEINSKNMHDKCYEYAHQFGDIFQVNLMNQKIIMINSESLIRLAATADGCKQYLNDKPATFFGDKLMYGSQCAVLCENGFSEEHNAYRKGFIKAIKEFDIGSLSLLTKIESYENIDFEIVSEIKMSLADTLATVVRVCLIISIFILN